MFIVNALILFVASSILGAHFGLVEIDDSDWDPHSVTDSVKSMTFCSMMCHIDEACEAMHYDEDQHICELGSKTQVKNDSTAQGKMVYQELDMFQAPTICTNKPTSFRTVGPEMLFIPDDTASSTMGYAEGLTLCQEQQATFPTFEIAAKYQAFLELMDDNIYGIYWTGMVAKEGSESVDCYATMTTGLDCLDHVGWIDGSDVAWTQGDMETWTPNVRKSAHECFLWYSDYYSGNAANSLENHYQHSLYSYTCDYYSHVICQVRCRK